MRKVFCLSILSFCLMIGCAAQNVANTPQHTLRLANADLAAALNSVESTALSAQQTGVITAAETVAVSRVINNATIASDAIEQCANKTTGTISGCIAPFIQSIQSQMTLAGLGIKSANATATFNTVINGVVVALSKITAAEAGQ